MAAKNVQQVLKKWTDRTAGSGEAMKSGVQGVSESPTAAAARAVDKWTAGVQRAQQDGSFVDGCNAVTKDQWVTSMTEKGIANMQTGVRAQATQTKQTKFLGQLLPFTAQVSQDVKGMPKNTEADADARMLAAVNKMRQFKRQR